jgi:hypothetical protein
MAPHNKLTLSQEYMKKNLQCLCIEFSFLTDAKQQILALVLVYTPILHNVGRVFFVCCVLRRGKIISTVTNSSII